MDPQEATSTPVVADEEQERAAQTLFRDIEDSGALPAHVTALEAADAVLCALEMRLPRDQAESIEHDVPPLLGILIRRCVVHRNHEPEIVFDQPAFLRLISSTLGVSMLDAERVIRAVFVAVQKHLPRDEIFAVRRRLPGDLKELWFPPNPAQLGQERSRPPADVVARPVEEPTESILRELEQSGVLPDGVSPTLALGAVLCSLSLELTGHEAQELADTSRTLQELLGPCATHRGERPQVADRPAFVRQLAEHMDLDEVRAEQIARTVFAAVRGRLPADEVQRIDGRIPRSVRALWSA